MTEHGAHHPGIGDLFWPAVNFILFAIVLVRALRGPVREYFRARTDRVRGALAAGARARQEAESLRAALAGDVAGLPALRQRLRDDLRETAERERATIVASGKEAAERIRGDARMLAEQEFAAARETLRAEVIDEAVRQATVIVRTALRPDDQERFVRDFVAATGVSA
jgi:F-type H+-transporting ATPase subunit b